MKFFLCLFVAQLIGAGVTVAHHIKLQSDVRTVITAARSGVCRYGRLFYFARVFYFFIFYLMSNL